MQKKEIFSIKENEIKKMSHFGLTFGSSNREGQREEERRRGTRGRIQKVWNFCMDSCIHDFGMIFVQEFLRYNC